MTKTQVNITTKTPEYTAVDMAGNNRAAQVRSLHCTMAVSITHQRLHASMLLRLQLIVLHLRKDDYITCIWSVSSL